MPPFESVGDVKRENITTVKIEIEPRDDPRLSRSRFQPELHDFSCNESSNQQTDNTTEIDGDLRNSRRASEDIELANSPENERKDDIPKEPLKTFLSVVFLGTGFFATAVSLAVTHERVPDIKPLPDIVLDNIMYQRWGLDVSEYLLIISTFSAFMVVMLHSYRLVIIRRICLLMGVLYYYRAITMFVTVLPKVDENYTCVQQLKGPTPTLVYLKRVFTILSGGGLSINGKHVYCGDYIFSGHTMTLTMGYLVVSQYSPSRYAFLHWVSFLVSLSGVMFLLLGRGHYTVDVVLAYYVTTRTWWVYHTMALNNHLKIKGEHNPLHNICWWVVFRFFERNIRDPLPKRYSLPIPNFAMLAIKSRITRLRGQNLVKHSILV